MSEFCNIIEAKHRDFIKEAFAGAIIRSAGKGLASVGRLIRRNPLKTTGLGLTGMDMISSAGRANNIAASGHSMAGITPKITM